VTLLIVTAIAALMLVPVFWMETPAGWRNAGRSGVTGRPLYRSADGKSVARLDYAFDVYHDTEYGVVTATNVNARIIDWPLKDEDPADHPNLPSRDELVRRVREDFDGLCNRIGHPELGAAYDEAVSRHAVSIRHTDRRLLTTWRALVFAFDRFLRLSLLVAGVVWLVLVIVWLSGRPRDASVRCARCGYLLVGLEGKVCPECGSASAGSVGAAAK